MSGTVTGPRSPRWALWQRTTIPCQDGLVYLVRLRVVQTPWFGVYLHDIFEPDNDTNPHDHPWSFISIILRGSYVERVCNAPLGDRGYETQRTWPRWSVHKMNRDTAHRITHASPGLRTLVLTGPRRGGWGFYTPEGFVPWQQYEGRP